MGSLSFSVLFGRRAAPQLPCDTWCRQHSPLSDESTVGRTLRDSFAIPVASILPDTCSCIAVEHSPDPLLGFQVTRPRASLQAFGYVEGIASLTASQSVPLRSLGSRFVICGLVALTPRFMFAALSQCFSTLSDPDSSLIRISLMPDRTRGRRRRVIPRLLLLRSEPVMPTLRSVASLCPADKGGCTCWADDYPRCCTAFLGATSKDRAARPRGGPASTRVRVPSVLQFSHLRRAVVPVTRLQLRRVSVYDASVPRMVSFSPASAILTAPVSLTAAPIPVGLHRVDFKISLSTGS